jgi:SAM-dependent methyltransferase
MPTSLAARRPPATLVPVEGYEPSTYGDRFADVYDDWYHDVTDVEACTSRLAALCAEAGGGPVLELGIGSGRLALPLVAAGLEVHGIDASAAMLDRLRSKPGGDQVVLTVGDMAELALAVEPAAGFALVFVAFNTLFNLPSEAQQVACLRRVRQLLAPGGRFVLEAFVPGEAEGQGIDGALTPRHITTDEVVLSVSQRDRAAQTVTGQHVHITEAGIRLRPWHLRYATPEQLDGLAASVGLDLVWRRAGWRDEPFTDDSGTHVSAYAPR